jgi:hypothetical protein
VSKVNYLVKMMMPMKYRQRQVEQILFRNASISPQYFTLQIKTKELNLVSVVTVEPSIVSIFGGFNKLRIRAFQERWTTASGSSFATFVRPKWMFPC